MVTKTRSHLIRSDKMLELIQNPQLIVKYMVIVLAVWFFILMITSKGYRISSLILFVFALINIITFEKIPFDILSDEYMSAYIDERWLFIKFDGVLALILTATLKYNEVSWKHASLLAFATVWHAMVLLYLVTDSQLTEYLTIFFLEGIISNSFLQIRHVFLIFSFQ